jgi:threonylcarbamoyladenosine tRNA methylthiotransferase MtaB
MESMLGKEQRVLIEKIDSNGLAHGYGQHYLPVQFKATQEGKNRFRQVLLDRVNTSESPTIFGSTV